MRTRTWLILAVEAALVALLVAAVASKRVPLGLPGEWEWLRVHTRPTIEWLLVAGLAVVVYSVLVAVGYRSLTLKRPSLFRESAWLALLLAAAIAIQVSIPTGAPDEYDLSRWAFVNYLGASTGYYQVAKKEALADPWTFLANYPAWVQGQDTLHIGTHPPGLIALQCVLLGAMERSPGAVDILIRFMPNSTAAAFRQLEGIYRASIPRADRAALLLSSLITLFACAGTVVPLYLLGRCALPASAAWAAASFWPLVPAANLFQPDADTAYPLLSTSALALAAWAARWALGGRGVIPATGAAIACGLVLAFGTFFTLAFLPVGLIVALVIGLAPAPSPARKAWFILAVGAGFLALTALSWVLTTANPVTVWSWNLRKHALFYVEYPRTYLAWLALNPIELAVAFGLPAVVWCLVGSGSPRSVPLAAWATFGVLVALDLAGRNRGEVARLWILFLPPLLLAAGAGFERLRAGPWALGITAALMGLQTLALQAMIQVVYPV